MSNDPTSRIGDRSSDDRIGAAEIDVAVIGGGISGLSAGFELSRGSGAGASEGAERERDSAIDFRVIEGSSRFGGKLQTSRLGSFLLESGPDSLVAQKPAGLELCRELGLQHDLIAPPGIDPTMGVVHRGRIVMLPRGLQMVVPTRLWPLFVSPLFSVRGKLDLWRERFKAAEGASDTQQGGAEPGRVDCPQGTRDSAPVDQTLREFIVRRFGPEAFDRVVEPIVGGLFTGDAERLSLELTAPRLAVLEREFGSVSRGSLELQRRARIAQEARAEADSGDDARAITPTKPPAQWALAAGMSQIVDRLVERLGPDRLLPEAMVRRITAVDDSEWGWRIEVAGAPALRARSVVLALPGPLISPLLAESAPEIAETCSRLEYASCAVVHLAYPKSALRPQLGGFGFFVPRTERSSILACSFPSEKFQGRAPADQVLLRAFVGGTRSPEMLGHSDDQLAERVATELETLLPIRGARSFERVERHPSSMPQFVAGYPSVIERLGQQLEARPGLFIAGSVVGAYGIPDCVSSGREAGRRAQGFALGSRESTSTPVSASVPSA